MIEALSAAGVAFVVTVIVVPIVRAAALRRGLLDVPNERSSHEIPTPRTGGVGIVIGAAVGATVGLVLIRGGAGSAGIFAAFASGAAIGFADDIYDVPVVVRFLGYLVCAALAVGSGALLRQLALPGLPALKLGYVGGFAFSVVFIAWYTNLFNFMDGIDGIAGGSAVITLGSLTVVFWAGEDRALGFVALAAAAGSLGFLFYNFPPAKVFMGDCGAVFLGLLAGTLSLTAVSRGHVSLAGAVLLMLPFVFDATFTLFRRAVRRERFWAPHRTHVYQQMCDLGLSYRSVTLIYLGLAIGCAALGLGSLSAGRTWVVVAWWGALGLFLVLALAVVVKSRRQAEGA